MNCVAYRDHFSAYCEGSLAISKRDLMQVHLDHCDECGPYFAGFARGLDVLNAERYETDADVAPMGDRMLAELGLPSRGPVPIAARLWGRVPRPARFAAAAAVVLAAGLGVATTGLGQSAMAGWLGLEAGPDGTWVPAAGVQRADVARTLGAEAPAVVASVPGVQSEVFAAAGFVRQGDVWITPEAAEAAAQRAAGKRRLDGAWLGAAEYEKAVRLRAGLIESGGTWVTAAELQNHARREAGQVCLDGTWMTREQAERLVLEAKGLRREGATWATAGEQKLREQLAAERARSEELTAAVARAERVAAQWRDREAGAGSSSPDSRTAIERPANTIVVSGATHRSLTDMLDGLRVLMPIQIGNTILVPLGQAIDRPVAPDSAVLSATSLMSSGVVRINNGTQIRLTNAAQQPVMVMAGEIIVGGKQDRLLSGDVVVASGGTVDLPVFCAEKDRSTAINGVTQFRSLSAWGTPALRRLIVSGANQDAIWSCIAAHHDDTRTRSGTQALAVTYATSAALDARAEAKDALDARLRPGDRAVGLAIVRDGAIEVLDVFPDPSFFRGQLESLLAGVTLDMTVNRAAGRTLPLATDPAKINAARGLVLAALQRVADAEGSKSATVGFATAQPETKLEVALGADGQPLVGYATVHEHRALHLCMVAPLTDAPPSRRVAAQSRRNPAGTTPVPPPAPPSDTRTRTNGELKRAKRLTEAEQRRLKRSQDGAGRSGGR